MQIAVLTFEGFNELDSFVAAAILNRMKAKGWAAHITCPTPEVTSMNGVTVRRQQPLEFAAELRVPGRPPVLALNFQQRRHQGFRHEATAVNAETAIFVGA